MSLALNERDPRFSLLERFAGFGYSSERAAIATLFSQFLLEHADCCERTCAPGHFTGSAWLVSPDGERVLLTLHRKLGKWLQLGGHADGDTDLRAVALREAEEESGIKALRAGEDLFDLDRHLIPAHGGDPAHWHYDVRFVVYAGTDENFVVSDESHALQWWNVRDVALDESMDESLRRMAQLWLAR